MPRWPVDIAAASKGAKAGILGVAALVVLGVTFFLVGGFCYLITYAIFGMLVGVGNNELPVAVVSSVVTGIVAISAGALVVRALFRDYPLKWVSLAFLILAALLFVNDLRIRANLELDMRLLIYVDLTYLIGGTVGMLILWPHWRRPKRAAL